MKMWVCLKGSAILKKVNSCHWVSIWVPRRNIYHHYHFQPSWKRHWPNKHGIYLHTAASQLQQSIWLLRTWPHVKKTSIGQHLYSKQVVYELPERLHKSPSWTKFSLSYFLSTSQHTFKIITIMWVMYEDNNTSYKVPHCKSVCAVATVSLNESLNYCRINDIVINPEKKLQINFSIKRDQIHKCNS